MHNQIMELVSLVNFYQLLLQKVIKSTALATQQKFTIECDVALYSIYLYKYTSTYVYTSIYVCMY